MRKSLYLLSALIIGIGAVSARQTLNVIKGSVAYNFAADNVGLMKYEEGESVNILGNKFDISDIEKITVGESDLADNTVMVDYSGNSARVTIAGNIASYVTAAVDGAHVLLTQSDEVGEYNCGEITYVLKGDSDDGSLTLYGSYKSTIELRGLTLTNPSGAAIDIENGKRIDLSVKNATVNTLIDGTGGKHKGTIYCKGHLEIKGKGELNVTGRTGHAIAAKEYVEMKNCSLNIHGAVKDGINCGGYFLLESGNLLIDGVDGDGIQVDYKDAEGERDAEDTGSLTIAGGNLNITLAGVASKGLKTEGDFTITGGNVEIKSSGAGEWDDKKVKTKASSCIGVDGDVAIKGGSLNLSATGGGGKGISCDGEFVMDSGNLNIMTSGGALVYTGGTLYQNYTGNLDRIPSDYKSSPKGIKSDGNLTLNGGFIYVKTLGNNGEGIESKKELFINGGDITVRAKDDAINSSSHMHVNGGVIDVIATSNDGLDSNGNLYINGGVIMAFGANMPECGIDANEEEGYTVVFTGGCLLAVGGNNSVPSSRSGSEQPYVSVKSGVKGGESIVLTEGDETLYTFNVPEDYSQSAAGSGPGGGWGGWGPGGGTSSTGMSILITTPDIQNGKSYIVQSGSNTPVTTTSRLTGTSGFPPRAPQGLPPFDPNNLPPLPPDGFPPFDPNNLPPPPPGGFPPFDPNNLPPLPPDGFPSEMPSPSLN